MRTFLISTYLFRNFKIIKSIIFRIQLFAWRRVYYRFRYRAYLIYLYIDNNYVNVIIIPKSDKGAKAHCSSNR